MLGLQLLLERKTQRKRLPKAEDQTAGKGLRAGLDIEERAPDGLTCQGALVDHTLPSYQSGITRHHPALLGQYQAVSGHQLTGVNPLFLCGTWGSVRSAALLAPTPSLSPACSSPPPGRHTCTRTDSLTMSLRVKLCCGTEGQEELSG